MAEARTQQESIVPVPVGEEAVFKAYARVCLIAFIGTVISIIMFLVVLNQNMRTLENDFRNDMTVQLLSLRHKIETLEQFWGDIQAFYESSHNIEYQEFRSFVEPALDRNSLPFMLWLPADQKTLSQDDIYIVAPEHGQTERFLPDLINQGFLQKFAIGEISKDITTDIVSSVDIKGLEQDKMIVMIPTFAGKRGQKEARITGIAITFLDIDLFFTSIFPNEKKYEISVFLNSNEQKTLIFQHAINKKTLPRITDEFEKARDVLSVRRRIPFVSQSIEVTAMPSFSYMNRSVGWAPWTALFLGLVITAFVAFWLYQQISRNIDIQKIVNEKTRALVSSEQRMRAILDNTVDGIITINEKGIVQTYNTACEKIFGYKAEEVIGGNVNILMPEPYHHEHDSYIANYLSSGKAKIIGIGREVEGRRKDGTIFPMDLSIGEVKTGDHHAFVGIVRDITERKESEQTKDLLASIVASSDDAIISKKLDGTITSWNAAAERLYGYKAEEAIGQKIQIIIPPDRLGEEKKIIDTLREGKTIEHYETIRLTKDEKCLDVSMTISPTRDSKGNIVGASTVARDITERKKSEARLKEYTENLKRSNQELDDFVYIVSHDLKEPLRGLSSYSQFLLEDYADKLDEEGQDKLNTLKKLSSRMEELIDTLLYYSRLGRSELAFKNTNLNKILQDTLELIEPVIKDNNATVEIHDKLPTIPCDKVRTGEIFRNLIVNAIKYNDSENKHIEVGCTTDHKEYTGQNVFYVADNGIGIDEKHRDIVFKMFKRLHGRDDYGGGTGSGLAFVKKIIDRHGGKIWIESNKDQGSVFYFTLEG